MEPLDFARTREFVNTHIDAFHQARLDSLAKLSLNKLLKKNPYLFKAKHIERASDLVDGLMAAFLSSSEEKLFGDFLEALAIHVAEQTCGGVKSAAQGVDLEFVNRDTHYVVSIKSGSSWGNSSQHNALERDLKRAEQRIKQSVAKSRRVQTVLGICYGKTRTVFSDRGYMKVVGQNFWYLISEDATLYQAIVEPIGYRARERNEAFGVAQARLANRLTRELVERFCTNDGAIDWYALVEFNSGNLDLDRLAG